MSVTVLFKALTAARLPVPGRTVTGKLRGPDGWLADHTGTILTESQTVSASDGTVELELTAQTEIAAAGTFYEIAILGTFARFYCVVPASNGPVQLADILVDPTTLQPVAAGRPSVWLSRAELGEPGGVTPLGSDGLVPDEYLPAGSGGGGAVDSVNGQTGVVVLAAADLGAVPATRQLLTGAGLGGGGTLGADRTIVLATGTITSLGKADTAVQPGQLAPVATAGTYTSLTGKPTIPTSYADLTGLVPTSALPALAVVEYLGAASNQAAMLALVGQRGDWCTRVDLGTTWVITGDTPSQLASWTALSYPVAPVLEVNGQTGVVELGKADVGLGNVANLAPEDMPVSDDQQAAINGRVALALVDAAGDLIVGTGDGTVTRLPKGTDDQLLAVAGATLAWVDRPSSGLRYDPVAISYQCKAITMDPADLSVGTGSGGLKFIAMASGRLYQMRVVLAAGETLSSVEVPIKALGAGAGSLWFGVYQADHTLLGSTANAAAAFTTGPVGDGAWRTVPLTAPAVTTGEFVWIAALSTLDTGPQLAFSEIDNANEFAWLLNRPGAPNMVRNEGVSVLPASIDPGTAIPYLDCLLGVA